MANQLDTESRAGEANLMSVCGKQRSRAIFDLKTLYDECIPLPLSAKYSVLCGWSPKLAVLGLNRGRLSNENGTIVIEHPSSGISAFINSRITAINFQNRCDILARKL